MTMTKFTMLEIATLAGVSKATVSRALNKPHLVNEDTRQKILKIMKEHKYVYNVNAADFSRKKASIIGLIIPTIKSSIHAESIHGIQHEAHLHNLALLIANSNYDIDSEVEFMNFFQQRRLAGLILTGVNEMTLAIAREFSKSGLPCVVTWEMVEDPEISYVGFDNRQAAYRMTKYLLDLDHTRIALIAGPVGKVRRATMRYQGYMDALAEYGIELDPSLVVTAEPSLENGSIATKTLLELRKPPTAIFATSDTLAIGALRAIKEAGLKVPYDISLAGFDDIDLASYSDPPLTTIRVPEYEMGEKAVQSLLVLMNKAAYHVEQYCLDTELIIRESCCKKSKPRGIKPARESKRAETS